MTVITGLPMFSFDVDTARAVYDEQGWYHAKGGVSPEMMSLIERQVAALMGAGSSDLAEWRYPDKKEQFLWDMPEGTTAEALCRIVANSTGMDPEKTVISERHLKVYSATAAEYPPPHKDRSASTVTVGIGIDAPADSRLVLWPNTVTTYNPYPTAAGWRNSRHADELPETVTKDQPNFELDLRRGDVVLFRGANFYHERHRPAQTTVLYLKFNDLGLDPLGEDPRTVEAEKRSARRLDAFNGAPLESGDVNVAVSPRLIGIRTDEYFPDLGVVETAQTFSSEHGIRLSASEAETLRYLARNGPTSAADLDTDTTTVERLISFGLVLAV